MPRLLTVLLAGSVTVVGSTVVADDACLAESISKPAKKIVAGFTLEMPTNGLSAPKCKRLWRTSDRCDDPVAGRRVTR